MVEKVPSFVAMQRRRMLYTLAAYLFSGLVAVGVLVYFPVILGVIVAPMVAYGIGWSLTQLVNSGVQARCPVCESTELAENVTLQCRLPEYQCAQCQQRFVGGEIVKKLENVS